MFKWLSKTNSLLGAQKSHQGYKKLSDMEGQNI